MSFTTPCFVRIEDADKRKELIEWLDGIGYVKCCCVYFDNTIAISTYNNRVHGILEKDSFGSPHYDIAVCESKEGKYYSIDCGDNIELFKALAAMNDDNCTEQWFIWNSEEGEKGEWRKFDDNPNWKWWRFECHKATIEDIIEHFKKI